MSCQLLALRTRHIPVLCDFSGVLYPTPKVGSDLATDSATDDASSKSCAAALLFLRLNSIICAGSKHSDTCLSCTRLVTMKNKRYDTISSNACVLEKINI
uniref:Uncharacterized protein n=1 Tax=Setaria italica TaxID=4555 RepID=K4AH41_SETIT